MPNHVRDFQRARHVRLHPGRVVPVRLGPHDGHRARLRRRRIAHGADLRGLRVTARHPSPRSRG